MTKTLTNPPLPPPERVPSEFWIVEASGDFRLLAAAEGEAGTNRLRRFTMTAYTGGKLLLGGFPHPVIVDLSGMKVPAKSRPILRDHDIGRIVGHTESIEINGSSIRLGGVISGVGESAVEVVASGDNGFPWQSSIGASAQRIVFVDRGEPVEVNGRKFTGPLYVARQSTLREVSFVALGADDQTTASVLAARQQSPQIEVFRMDFEQWLAGLGFDPNTLSEPQSAGLRGLYDARSQSDVSGRSDGAADAGRQTVPPASETPASAPVNAGGATSFASPQPPLNPVDEMRAQWAAERKRLARIDAICGPKHAAIAARAVEEGWDENRTELEVLRASRPQIPAVLGGTPPMSARTLEAAAWLSARIPEKACLAEFGERTLEAAHPMRHVGLRELVVECARMEGMSLPRVFGDGTETIRAGFSTVSLPGILESVMNRTMLAAYEASPIAALQLCSVGSVSDFKQVTRYRLLGTGGVEKDAPSGELKSGALGEQPFSNKAETYGQILMLTRQDVINDDLNAFLDIVIQMGRSGAQSIDDVFFTLFLSNPGSFFSTGNGNYLEGAATAFGPDSLTSAKTLFRKQKAGPGTKAKDQKPINVRPRFLIVPVEIETDAELLMGSAQLMIDASGAPTKIPVDNPHRNKYEVVSMPHLSDSYYTGASAKAWYLFADPALLPAFEIVFLNGRRTPVIERVEAPPNNLGMGFRGWIDFGVKEQDPKGAVKVKGEA